MAALADIEFRGPDVAATRECNAGAEFEFLLECCRRDIDAAHARSTVRLPLDWDRTLKVAEHHRVLPALYSAVENGNELPARARNEIRSRFHKHGRQTAQLCAELIGILRGFREHGIQALPYKGAVLGQLLFGDAAMRQFGDLDFLIRPSDIPRARAALLDLGYKANLTLSPRHEAEYVRVGNEYVFGCERGKNLVELQWQILPRFYSIAFDMEKLFARSVQAQFEGEAIRVLGKEDLMLVLCAHAAKHEWEHLGMVGDIAKLARLDLDWEWIEAEARRLGILRILTISLLLARNLLLCEFPLRLRPDKQCHRLAGKCNARLRTSQYSDADSTGYFREMMALRERWRDRAHFAWRLAVTSNVSEWNTVTLPDRMFFCYRAVRGMRLIRRWFGSYCH